MVEHLLPQDIHRVLYLDCDIVVRGDLKPLWDTELQGFVIAAVKDDLVNPDVKFKTRLGLREDAVYFNAGVMLIDLKKWRQEEVGKKILDICARRPETLTYWDQCALNAYFNGRFWPLDSRWNEQSISFTRRDDVPELAKRAVIVHFTSAIKPWQYTCSHPLASLYRHALKNTPWRDYVPADRTIRNVAERHLRWHLKPVLPIIKRARGTLQSLIAERC